MHNTTLRTDNLSSTISYLTKNKSLSLLLILISQIHNVPKHDNENYHYHYAIMLHDEEIYKQIRDTQKKNIRALLKLWIKSLTYKIFIGTDISPEDKRTIEQKIHETIENNKLLLSGYPNDNMKDILFQEFVKNILKSKLTERLKLTIKQTLNNANSFNRCKKELMDDIALMTHDPDGIAFLACHGITVSNTTNLTNTPISKEIKRLYKDIMGVNPDTSKRIFDTLPSEHTAKMIWDTIKTAHRKLKSREDSIERFVTGTYPWYSIINNIKKMINNSLFGKPRLEKERFYLNKIRNAFKKVYATETLHSFLKS